MAAPQLPPVAIALLHSPSTCRPSTEDGDQGSVQDHRVLGHDWPDRRDPHQPAVINGGDSGTDEFIARQAWLYVAILGGAYFISRGLAKSGSSDPYWNEPDSSNGRDRDR